METKKIIKYYKRFANGEQFIEMDGNGKIINNQKEYFWQTQRVFNHIKPLIDVYGKEFTEKELYGPNGIVSFLEPYQKAYNEVMNNQLHYIKFSTEGIMLVEDGSVDVDAISEDGICAGKVLVYRQGSRTPELQTNEVKTEGFIKTAEFYLNRMYQIISNFVEAKKQAKENK